MQEFVGQADGAQRQTDRTANAPFTRDGKFATAAAKIHHQDWRRGDTQAGYEPEVNESGLFNSGDDADLPSGGGAYPLQESMRVARIPKSAGGNHSHRIGSRPLHGAMKSAKHLHRIGDGFRREEPAAENGFTQTRNLAVFVDFGEAMMGQACDLKADRVGSNIDSGEGRHGMNEVVYSRCSRLGETEKTVGCDQIGSVQVYDACVCTRCSRQIYNYAADVAF